MLVSLHWPKMYKYYNILEYQKSIEFYWNHNYFDVTIDKLCKYNCCMPNLYIYIAYILPNTMKGGGPQWI